MGRLDLVFLVCLNPRHPLAKESTVGIDRHIMHSDSGNENENWHVCNDENEWIS